MPARRQSKKRNSRAKSVSFKRASSRSNVTGKGRYTFANVQFTSSSSSCGSS